MARKSTKSVYERIEEKKQNIKEVEEMLAQLNNELQELYSEKDDLEMRLLLSKVKESGLDIDEALKLLQTSCPSGHDNDQDNEQDKPKKRNKKVTTEENNLVEE